MTSIEMLKKRLVRFPDDWTDWMVYADWLTERGDVRGELLAIEHSLWAGRENPAANLTDDDVANALWYSDAIATEWIADHEDQLSLDQRSCASMVLDLGRALLHLESAPTRMRALLEKRSHVVGILEPGATAKDNGASIAAREFEAKLVNALVAWISEAFNGALVPDDQHLTLFQAEAQDNRETCDRSQDHVGRWQELPDAQLLDNQWALTHLDEQGVLYYFPAAMCFALRHLDTLHPDDSWLTESLEYNLQPSSRQLRDHQRGRFRLFSRRHRAAIHAFNVAAGNHEAAEAWTRVAEAERLGDNPEWFDHYSKTGSDR